MAKSSPMLRDSAIGKKIVLDDGASDRCVSASIYWMRNMAAMTCSGVMPSRAAISATPSS